MNERVPIYREKNCSKALGISKMPYIKYIRIAKMKKADTTKCRQGREAPTLLMAVKNCTAVSWKVYVYVYLHTDFFFYDSAFPL